MSHADYEQYAEFERRQANIAAGRRPDAKPENFQEALKTISCATVQPVEDMTTDEDREQWLSGDRDNSEAEQGAADWWDSDSDDAESEEEY